MTLYKLNEYYPDYQNEIFDGYDIKSFDMYAQDIRRWCQEHDGR